MSHTNKVEEIVDSIMEIHYEPEHESGQTCWCEPITMARQGVAHIEHNEQRVILREKLTQALSKTRQETIEECMAVVPEERNANLKDSIGRKLPCLVNKGFNDARTDFIKALEQLKQNK